MLNDLYVYINLIIFNNDIKYEYEIYKCTTYLCMIKSVYIFSQIKNKSIVTTETFLPYDYHD